MACALSAACAGDPARFHHTFGSPEALAAAVLDAVARRDRAYLESLALSEEEFRELVWPSLPAARPGRNLPWAYVWKDLHQKSGASLTQTLAQHGGRRYALEAVTFGGHASRHGSFDVHRAAGLRVRTESGGVETVRLFGSALVSGGRWTLFSYVVD
jgi:hypothetical protein